MYYNMHQLANSARLPTLDPSTNQLGLDLWPALDPSTFPPLLKPTPPLMPLKKDWPQGLVEENPAHPLATKSPMIISGLIWMYPTMSSTHNLYIRQNNRSLRAHQRAWKAYQAAPASRQRDQRQHQQGVPHMRTIKEEESNKLEWSAWGACP